MPIVALQTASATIPPFHVVSASIHFISDVTDVLFYAGGFVSALPFSFPHRLTEGQESLTADPWQQMLLTSDKNISLLSG